MASSRRSWFLERTTRIGCTAEHSVRIGRPRVPPLHIRASTAPEPCSRRSRRLGNEEDDALLAAALKRLRGRSIQWMPPMLEFTPVSLLGWCAVLTARDWNDPDLERAGLQLMGYRPH